MIKKILLILCISILIFPKALGANIWDTEIWTKPNIIPRASWGANSQYNSRTDIYWKDAFQARDEHAHEDHEETQAELNYRKKTEEIEWYLYWNFLNQFSSQETIREKENGTYSYVWPLKYTNYIDSIIVHHTHSEYTDDLTWLQWVHRYHSLSNRWWDIWYNYIIWYDGLIYEWREGWDYVVWAHSKYNNFGTVWIALLWNYDTVWINPEQYESLENLIQYLIVRYWIDLNNNRYYHRNCSGTKCNTFHLETYLESTLIWHRDATHTTCPWEKLYEQIDQIRSDNLDFSAGRQLILRDGTTSQNVVQNTNTSQIQKILVLLRKFSTEEKENILDLIDIKKAETTDAKTIKTLQTIRLALILSLKEEVVLDSQ